MAAIMYTPTAHTLKTVVAGTPRYSGSYVIDVVRKKIFGSELFFFGDDRFMPPFLDLIVEKYKGGTHRLYWIFPTLMGNRVLEETMVQGFVCLIIENKSAPVIWFLNRDRIRSWQTNKQNANVVVETFRRHLLVDFAVDEVLYDVHDSVLLRGRVSSIVAVDNDDGLQETLYPSSPKSLECPGKQQNGVSVSKWNE